MCIRDSYCRAGTVVYLYTQISWIIDIGECREELPYLKTHLRNEIIY